MPSIQRAFFEAVYRRAGTPERLPWHRGEPPALLVEAASHHGPGARALDVGCGAGDDTLWLARQGFDVTAFDFVPRAVELTRQRLAAERLHAEVMCLDARTFASWQPFDLVLDAACMHGFGRRDRHAYRARLLEWLSPEGDFVLTHFGKRHPADWRPVGPHRWSPGRIRRFFAPELEERAFHLQDVTAPLPIGPRVRVHHHWFRRI